MMMSPPVPGETISSPPQPVSMTRPAALKKAVISHRTLCTGLRANTTSNADRMVSAANR